jgi:hypothetical protein
MSTGTPEDPEDRIMNGKKLVLTAAAALLIAPIAGTASAQDFQAQTQSFVNAQQYGRGGWDRDHDRGGWNDRFRAMTLEGRWVADDRNADFDGFRGRGPMNGLKLPDVFTIDQRPNMVTIANRRNRTIQVVMLGGKFDRWNRGDRPDYLNGRLYGSTLVVEHPTPRGTVTQSFALQDRGHTLVVTTRREGFRTMEFTTTYHRA